LASLFEIIISMVAIKLLLYYDEKRGKLESE